MATLLEGIASIVEYNLWLVREVARQMRSRWHRRRPFNYTPSEDSELYWPLPEYHQLVSLRTRAHFGFRLVGPGTYRVGEDKVWTLGYHEVTGYRILEDSIILGFGPRDDPFRQTAAYSPDLTVVITGSMTIYKRKKENHCHIFEVISHEHNNVTTFVTNHNYQIIGACLE
jgi:hypothetical protein